MLCTWIKVVRMMNNNTCKYLCVLCMFVYNIVNIHFIIITKLKHNIAVILYKESDVGMLLTGIQKQWNKLNVGMLDSCHWLKKQQCDGTTQQSLSAASRDCCVVPSHWLSWCFLSQWQPASIHTCSLFQCFVHVYQWAASLHHFLF